MNKVKYEKKNIGRRVYVKIGRGRKEYKKRGKEGHRCDFTLAGS